MLNSRLSNRIWVLFLERLRTFSAYITILAGAGKLAEQPNLMAEVVMVMVGVTAVI